MDSDELLLIYSDVSFLNDDCVIVSACMSFTLFARTCYLIQSNAYLQREKAMQKTGDCKFDK